MLNTSYIGRQSSSGSLSPLQDLSVSCSSGWSNLLPRGHHLNIGQCETMPQILQVNIIHKIPSTLPILPSPRSIAMAVPMIYATTGTTSEYPHLFSTIDYRLLDNRISRGQSTACVHLPAFLVRMPIFEQSNFALMESPPRFKSLS